MNLTRSLAVLYFENRSGSIDDEYFRDGVTEDLIIELLRIRGLDVLPRSSVLRFRDRRVDAAEAGCELGVEFVLEGSLRRVRDRLEIETRLVASGDGRVIGSDRYDRRVEDVLSIQADMAAEIAHKLEVVLTDAERQRMEQPATRSVPAYDCYLKGRHAFRRFRRRSIEEAMREFEAAIELDPQYAHAYAGLADCYSYLQMFWEARSENVRRAEQAGARAVELAPDLSEAHVARGVAATLSGRHEEAERELKTAAHLDPMCFEAYYFLARTHYSRGELDRAVYWFGRAGEARPEDYQAATAQGSALVGLGLKADARVAYRRALELAGKHLETSPEDARALYFSAIALSHLGESSGRALDLAAEALALDPEEPQVLYNVACVYALQRMSEQAVDCLRRTLPHGDLWRRWMVNDPDLDSLREDARFQELCRPAG